MRQAGWKLAANAGNDLSRRVPTGDDLRTGTYSKTLTFTLSTTNP